MHWAFAGLVWQIDNVTGRATPPVSADAVICPLAPTFTVATEKKPVPLAPGMFTMPFPDGVAPSATMSGWGVSEADIRSVLRPVTGNAEGRFVQPKLSATSVAPKGALGVRAIRKVCGAPGGMLAGVFGVPVRA